MKRIGNSIKCVEGAVLRNCVIVAVLLVTMSLMLVFLTGCSSTSSNGNSSAASSLEQKTTQPAEKYTITEEAVDTSNPYNYKITGKLTNNTDKTVSYVQVKYILKDAEGAQVGTAWTNTSDLAAGGVWKFEASSLKKPEEVVSYELSDVTGF